MKKNRRVGGGRNVILRKPYAFLIRNFKKINIVLLALVIFVLWKELELYQFIKDYIATGVYSTQLDSIGNYVNIFSVGAIVLIAIISAILAYLLKYKDKPFISYVIILGVSVITLILFIYNYYYFTMTAAQEFDLVSALMIRDLSFIATIPHYPVILLLLIRSIGLDLKRFGFGEDKEFAEINDEDREEVEVEITFDKDRYIRMIRKNLRYLKYTFLEHKFSISALIVLVVLLASFNVYHYAFVVNKVYSMGENVSANGLNFQVENAYITNRDYTGNQIAKSKYYFILDVKITNNQSSDVPISNEYFFLYVDNQQYTPSERFNLYFSDIGTLYSGGKKIKATSSENVLFVFEIDAPKENSNFLLTYRTGQFNDAAKRIRVQVRDISKFIEKANVSLGEELTVPINLEKEWTFSLSNFALTNTMDYRYEQCNAKTCPIYEATLESKENQVIFYAKYKLKEGSKKDFLDFLKTYGKIRYTINGETKEMNISYLLTNYRGDHLFIAAPSEMVNATNIELYFTVRTYQYFYQLKGE